MIAWIMVLEEPREDGRRLQEPDQRKRVLRQVQARQPVGVKVSIKPPRSRSPSCDKTLLPCRNRTQDQHRGPQRLLWRRKAHGWTREVSSLGSVQTEAEEGLPYHHLQLRQVRGGQQCSALNTC